MWPLRRGALDSEGDRLTEGLTESSAHGRECAGKGTRDRGQEMVLSGFSNYNTLIFKNLLFSKCFAFPIVFSAFSL